MESWVLEGDSYSFLRSASRNIDLQRLDGPNRVEIFDITNISSHRSAISETTCLCDIFGDDCESPSLSSSPAVTSSLRKYTDERCEDVNDSSGSYHTANGSEHLSDASEAFEDSKDTKDPILSPESNTSDLDLENGGSFASNVTSKRNRRESRSSQDAGFGNSSEQQLVTSTSEYRDTNIRVSGPAQEVISADLFNQIKGILNHASSDEFRETDSLANGDLTEQKDNSTSESDSTHENGDAVKSWNIPKENNHPICSGDEEEQTSVSDILHTRNNSALQSDISNDDATQTTDLSAEDGSGDMRGMSASPESTLGTRPCDDKAEMSDFKDPSVSVQNNSEACIPRPYTVPPETPEPELFAEQRHMEPFSDPGEKPPSCESRSGSSVDVDYTDPPIIIHSPVGFSLSPSPEPEKKTWFTGPEDLDFIPQSPESEYRLTPTASVSSFDSKLCPTPESRSVTSTPESNHNTFICEVTSVASSAELRSVSNSPEMQINTCSSTNQHSLQFASQNQVLTQTHDVEGNILIEGFTLPEKDFADTPSICHRTPEHGDVSSLSTLRDTTSPDLKTRDTKSPLTTNTDISSNVSMDTCAVSLHSSQRPTESPDVQEIRFVENSIPSIETSNTASSRRSSNVSSTGETRSPSTPSISRDASSPLRPRSTEIHTPNTLSTGDRENIFSSSVLGSSSAEGGASRPPSSASGDSGSANVNETASVENPESTLTAMADSSLPTLFQRPTESSATNDTTFPAATSPQICISTTLPIKELENVLIAPIKHRSSPDGGLSRSPSSSAGDTQTPDVSSTRCLESSTRPNESTSHLSSAGTSKPSSSPGVSRNTVSPGIDGIKYKEIHTNVENSSVINVSVTEGKPETSGDSSVPRNPRTSPVSAEGRTSRSPSLSSISVFADSDVLRSLESPISTENQALNTDVPAVFNISTIDGGLPKPPLTNPREITITDIQNSSFTVRCEEIVNEANDSSTEGRLSGPSPALSVPRDRITTCPDVDEIRCGNISAPNQRPTNISPVHHYSSTNGGISANSPKSNYIPVNQIQNSSVSKLTSPSVIRRNPPSSPGMMYGGPSNDHVSAAEPSLGHTDNHIPVSEKVEIPLMIPRNAGQTDDSDRKIVLVNDAVPRNNCTIITSSPHSQPENTIASTPETPAPKLSVKQIKENWEKMNESILNSLDPWLKSKKTLTPPVAKERNDSGKVWEFAGSGKTLGAMAPRGGESPGVLHGNNRSMYEGQWCRNKGWSGERVTQEEHALGKGVENLAEGSYRGEQVDLSFRTRNRKGPANHSPAPSSRDPKSGIPPLYFESPLATRRQQSLFRAQNLQKENNTGARRVRSSSQGNYRGARASECTSETSSMGSEFDDADTEVKWFTDQAFRSLSSPQVDYLDVYNSSRGSTATSVSQPSTVDSPGSAPWISYADLHENDNALRHGAAYLPSGTLNPARRFEMGSFECVDIAVENKEETRRAKRTVPKRQILFKRRNYDESEVKAMDSLSTETCTRETLVRQHSTPAASMQEDLAQGDPQTQSGKKMLQKSASLDECSPKSKMASSVIKSVLSKKMDTTTKESSSSEAGEDRMKPTGTLSAMEPSNEEIQTSRTPSECGSQDVAGNEEKSPHPSRRRCTPPKVPPKPIFKPNTIPSNNCPTDVVCPDKPFVKDQIKHIMVDSIESKRNPENERIKVGEKFSSDSGSVNNWAPKSNTISLASTPSGRTNSENKQPPETHKQQEGSSSTFLSKTPEITLKSTTKDKYKSPPKASPEWQRSKDVICEPRLEETLISFKPVLESDNEEDSEKIKAKSVMHKVRDVRKLVKNTYNLSFKASNTGHVEDVQPKMAAENPHPLQIECKAISWKDKKASGSKSTNKQEDAEEMQNHLQTNPPQGNDLGVTQITGPSSNVQHSDTDPCLGLDQKVSKSGDVEQPAKLETPPRPSSKEISTLVFLQDSTVQKPTSPVSPSVKAANSSHSVSMLRKEKGMQADIGVCDVLSDGAGAKPKHINRLEVPLQIYASEANEVHKGKKDVSDQSFLNSALETSEGTSQVSSSPMPKMLSTGKAGVHMSQRAKEQEITLAKPEVRTNPSNAKVHAMPVTTSKEIELPIQVRSISCDRPKPAVLPKPNYKQPFAEIRSTSTDVTPTSVLKEQTHLKSDVKIIETSATVVHREQSDSNAKTSAVSSHNPQTSPISVPKTTAATRRQEVSITSRENSSNQQNHQEQVIPTCNYQTSPAVSQNNTYTKPTMRTSTGDGFHFAASDDPPSYDERESFSPLQVSDLPPRRQNRYHPTTKHSLCSCTSCTQPQFNHPYHSSQNQTPPAPRSPGQVISYPGAPPQAQVRPHQCRPDGQPLNYTSVSPKTTVQQSPAMIQPMHHSHAGIQAYSNEQPSAQHMDRRSGNQRSPQAPSGAAYREHNRSPNIAALDPRAQFYNPQDLPPVFPNEYGSDASGSGGMLYPENSSGLGYGQGPRRVLLDPETGKYFYIEVPMHPLRKMLFDPEIGQYVEVLIPQQTMSNSSMYPPTAAPYQGPYHGQGLYTSQYLPYSMPPHPQSAQQPRPSEPSVPTSLHQNTMGYGSSASQAPKSDVKGLPSLDQSYLENMYYIPTGMNASPNSTPSDCYHKPATKMPAAGGRRA